MRYLRGLFASALGSGTGTILALSLGILWPLGAILGGLVGYLSYDFGAVRAASTRAYRRLLAARFDTGAFKMRLRICFSFAMCAAAIAQALIWVVLIVIKYVSGASWSTVASSLVGFLIVLPAGVFCFMLVFAFDYECTEPHPYPYEPERSIQSSWATARNFNIVMMHYWLVVGMVMLVRWLVPRIILAIVGLARIVLWVFNEAVPALIGFVATVFVDIYSDVRLITGIAALAGALTGYRHESVVEGVACAAILFTFQYVAIHLPVRHFSTARS